MKQAPKVKQPSHMEMQEHREDVLASELPGSEDVQNFGPYPTKTEVVVIQRTEHEAQFFGRFKATQVYKGLDISFSGAGNTREEAIADMEKIRGDFDPVAYKKSPTSRLHEIARKAMKKVADKRGWK